MSVLSTIIGWTSQHTVLTVYNYVSELLKSTGQVPPTLSLQSASSLIIVKNMIIYNTLIGTLVALIMGYYVGMNDRIAKVIKLIFTRPIKKYQVFLGKTFAILIMLGILIVASFIITLSSMAVFHALSRVNVMNVAGFYGLSYIYILGFGFVGLGCSFIAKNSGTALLYALIFWIIITFVLPELSSALYPTSSLNPVLPDTNILQSSALQTIHIISFPFSVSEHYKHIAGELIGVNDITSPTYYKNNLYDILVLIIWMLTSFGFAYFGIKKISSIQGDLAQ